MAANDSTLAVNLWLASEPLHAATRSLVENTMQEARLDEDVIEGVWTIEEATRSRVADALEDWASSVDWNEVADALIEEMM